MEENIIKITDKIISIPPYLSTGWNSIAHIRTVSDRLVFTMKDGESISVPGSSQEMVKQVFDCHMRYLEGDGFKGAKKEGFFNMKLFGSALPEGLMPPADLMRMGVSSPDFVNMMQHNGEQKNLPDLPFEAIDKITKIMKIVAPSDPDMFPKAEPHCNCAYCQIARNLSGIQREPQIEISVEEIVSLQELNFSQYHIETAGDKLYHVVDKLFPAEKFTVFLGEPVGCTCGKTGCEHIIAVLKS